MTVLASMTAFARATATVPQGSLAWEIKTVNNKGLDVRLRLPPGFDAQDVPARAAIARVIARGSIQATLTLQGAAVSPQVRINASLLRTLIAAAAAAMPQQTDVAPPTMDGLLAIRGVVEVSEGSTTAEDLAALGRAALALLDEALDAVRQARESEGAALGRVLHDHLAAIERLTQGAERAPGRRPEAVRGKLGQAIDALTGASPLLDPERLHQEAILLAARADIREELDRLTIHGRSATDLLAGGGPVGRRLDFLAQELAREANTLCAKSNDAGLTGIGLDLRNRIEQFREQIQNLE